MPSTISKFARTKGLSICAKGAVIRPSNGLDVLCVKLAPLGTKMALLKKGLRP